MNSAAEPSAPKNGSKIVVVLALLAALVVGGAVAAYFVFFRGAGANVKFIETTVKMAPENTQVYMAFNLAHFGWDTAMMTKLYKIAEKDPDFQKAKDEFKSKMGFELSEETLTWLSPKAMALYIAPSAPDKTLFQDFMAASQGSVPPSQALFIAEMNDKTRMASFLEKFTAVLTKESKVTFKDEAYKGVTLHVPSELGKAPSWAVQDGLVLAAFSPESLKSGLDRMSGNAKSLADNPRYKKAMAKFKHTDGTALYVDFKSALKDVPTEAAVTHPVAKKFLAALDYMALGGGRQDDRTQMSEWLVHFDFPADEALAKAVFPAPGAIEMRSVQVFPGTSEFYGSLNLRTLWEVGYALAGADPETAPFRDMPELKLKQMGIDLKADILDVLTGELAYSVEGLSKLLDSYAHDNDTSGSGAAASALTQLMIQRPAVLFALGVNDQEKAAALLARVGGPMLMTFQPSEHKGVKIYSYQDIAYAFFDGFFVAATPGGKEKITALIDNKGKAPALAGTTPYKSFASAAPSNKPLMLFYYDLMKYYETLGKEPKMKEYLAAIGDKMGHLWNSLSLTSDGIHVVSVTTSGK